MGGHQTLLIGCIIRDIYGQYGFIIVSANILCMMAAKEGMIGFAMRQSGDSSNFFRDLETFEDFEDFANPAHYVAAPDDWALIITDIRTSLSAIKDGRYRDINLVGAACIAAARNGSNDTDIGYVFGGDGAALFVPPSVREAVLGQIVATRQWAAKVFDLDLRVSAFDVASLRRRGKEVLVAKFGLGGCNTLALFNGGGLELAEALTKRDESDITFTGRMDDRVTPDLSGLSCRWEPLHTRKGIILTLLIHATGAGWRENDRTYSDIAHAIGDIVGHGRLSGSPVHRENMIEVWPPSGLRREALAQPGALGVSGKFIWLHFETLMVRIANKFNIPIGTYRPRAYHAGMRRNADYRKFDDMLRMVIDCSPKQHDAIIALLENYAARGKIVFGMQMSRRAIMTCLIFSLSEQAHVHFIDGEDGGYALAAIALKAQLAQRRRRATAPVDIDALTSGLQAN